MTRAASVHSERAVGLFRNSHRGNFIRFSLFGAFGALGIAFAVSAMVDLFDSGDVTLEFLAAAVACAAAGALARRGHGPGRLPTPDITSVPAIMTMATLAWTVVALGGAVAHLISNSTNNINTALLEGMAIITTTSMTSLDPDSLPMGLHMFRALMQWAGGLGGIVLAVVAIPVLLGGRELTGRAQAGGGSRALITGRTRGVHLLVRIYVGLTVTLVVAYGVAGMGIFDSLAHAMATASTGGLSTRSGSLAGFDSAAIEWVAVGGMTVAGLNIGVIWWVLNRNRQALREASELRAFASVFATATIALALWSGTDGAGSDSIRQAAVAVSSAMSTTGFTAGAWSKLEPGPQVILVLLMSVGAMGGSAGGGVRYLRLIEAAGFARRELRTQLHPSAVGVVRVNGHAVDEATLARLTGYIVMYFLVASIGAILIALGDTDIAPGGAITLAVSALSTTGAQTADPISVAEIGAVSKWALAGLMLLGRVSIYSGIVAAITVVTRLREHLARTRWDDTK